MINFLKGLSSLLVGIGVGSFAIYTAEALNISPILTAIPAISIILLWSAFVTDLKFD